MASILRLAFCAGITLATALAQDVPSQPFQAVHLYNIKSAGAEKTILAALADYNQAIKKAGCAKCIYHLWKGTDQKSGERNYLWISSWPGREVYVKVHQSDEYLAVEKRHPELGPALGNEIYDRYVEIKPGQ
jgi:hypothetical protein